MRTTKTALEIFGVHRARCAAGPGEPWRDTDDPLCDCGFAAAIRTGRANVADWEAQTIEGARVLAEGWTPIRTVTELRARYGDRTIADALPRAVLYLDLGYLVGELESIRRSGRVQ